MTDLRHATTRRLHRIVLDRQRTGRLPGVFAGVVRGGGLVWEEGIGAAHLDDPDTVPDAPMPSPHARPPPRTTPAKTPGRRPER